jgi:hypothetical protein
MTIHMLFTEYEQQLLHEALEAQLKKCKSLATASIKGFGNAKEFEKKTQWARKADEIQDLLNKMVDLSI